MTPAELWERFRTWRHRDALDRDVEEELEAHTAMLARDLEKDGLTAADALAEARRKVGHRAAQRDYARDAWGFPRVDAVLQDARYAIRGLRRSPAFALTVVLTLGLGIGANAAMFAVIDRLMFRPLPFIADASRTARVYLELTPPTGRFTTTTMPYTRYADLASRAPSADVIAAVSEWRLAVGLGAETRVRKVAGVSPAMWRLFDVTPERGRFFGPGDDQVPRGNTVAVISHSYWQSAFGGRDVIGERLRVGILDYTIVGIAPKGFHGATTGGPIDVYVPVTTIPATMSPASSDTYYKDYRWDWIEVLVRRSVGASTTALSAELSRAYSASRAIQRATSPRTMPDSVAHPHVIVGPVRTNAGPDAGMEMRVLWWVSGVAAIVLLIACANVTNLMLARTMHRRREISLRLALGVSRARLAGMFLVEAFLLAAGGIVAGLIVAQWAGIFIRTLLLPEGSSFNLAADGRTIAVASLCALMAAVVTVAAPILMTLRADLNGALKSGAREGGYRSSRLRTSLLVAQGALSVALLAGAGAFVQSLQHVRSIRLGVDVANVIDVEPDFRGDRGDSATRLATATRLLRVAQSIPGVEAASRYNTPLFWSNTANLRVPGIDSVERLGRFTFQLISPDYFRTMGTRILRGRAFDNRDVPGASRTVIVSESMARRLWPNAPALGQCIYVSLGDAPSRDRSCTQVVGITEDVVQQRITDEAKLVYYLPIDQVGTGPASMYLRMRPGDLDADLERVRRAMQAAMPGDGFVTVSPLQKRVDDERSTWTLGATLFTGFGVLALIVAAVGLYGSIGYDVEQRRHELGVRLALGATRGGIVRLIVSHAIRITAAGTAAGLLIATAGSRWLEPLLYKQSARDPFVYGAIGSFMMVVALVAASRPAVDAMSSDPNSVLRSD
jgi:predicted permease